MVEGRPSLRSVDNEIKRCAIEPRNIPFCPEPSSLSDAGAVPGTSDTWTHWRARSDRGRRTWRLIRNVLGQLATPCRLHPDGRREHRLTNSRLIHSFRARLVLPRGARAALLAAQARERRPARQPAAATPQRGLDSTPGLPGRVGDGSGVSCRPLAVACLERKSPGQYLRNREPRSVAFAPVTPVLDQ